MWAARVSVSSVRVCVWRIDVYGECGWCMGENGFLWMLRGHRHGGTGKQGKTEAHMVAQDMLFTLWPGKFPPKICADRHIE